MSIEHELAEVLGRIDAPEEVLSVLIADSVHLCHYNEDRIALENLCDNLFEDRITIMPEVRDRLLSFCRRFRVDANRCALLNALTLAPSGSVDG